MCKGRLLGSRLVSPVFQAVGKQCALTAIHPFNEAPHLIPPHIAQESYSENHTDQRVFTQPGSRAEELTLSRTFPLFPTNRKSMPTSNTSGSGQSRAPFAPASPSGRIGVCLAARYPIGRTD